MRRLIVPLVMVTLSVFAGCAVRIGDSSVAPGLRVTDPYTIVGRKSFIDGYDARHVNGDINVVVEIPAGTTAKWEVDKADGNLRWEFKGGSPRRVKYLAYPANYGMIPGTVMSKEMGGDGDPLDAIILGPALPRGSVAQAKLIGVLKLLDKGERDDKLLLVVPDTPLYQVSDLNELDEKFVGVTTIVETWFSNYKGPGKMKSLGYADAREARDVLDAAVKEFDR